MIAMQYKIILPSDYPMDSIKKRISDKGHLLNGFPGLVFKAYLYSEKSSLNYHNPVNSYAPFYVWEDHESMNSFLNCDGFKALCDQFGRPKIDVWFIHGEVTEPQPTDLFACIGDNDKQNNGVKGVNYALWNSFSINWLSKSEVSKTQYKEVYSIGYVAR